VADTDWYRLARQKEDSDVGLDAAVSCTCYREGRAISPFPEHIIVNEDGWVELDWPTRGHEDEHDIFEEWLYSACEHPRMDFCQVRISNWGGYRSFQSALEETGWEHFPTLHTYLPENNGCHLPADASGTALEELETFRRICAATVPVLVNAETGDLVKSPAHQRDAVGISDRVMRVGVRLLPCHRPPPAFHEDIV
jgi:hypothetical protein